MCEAEKEKKTAKAKKYYKLRNLLDESKNLTDTLFTKFVEPVFCTETRCELGILNNPPPKRPTKTRPKEEVLRHAKDFIDQVYVSMKKADTKAHKQRWADVEASIEKTGLYELEEIELIYGAKTAWRNAPRCIGRIQWSKLQVFDARYVTTARGMFECICNHIKYGTNKGNLRSAITVFKQRTDGEHDFRVWNGQLVTYASYELPDGTILGDPANVEFTKVCMQLGWKGKGSPYDVLPLVLQANGQDPEVFDVPPDLVLEVPLVHPQFAWFAEMKMKWYAIPAVSGMLLDCGGIEFPACPFNGWYMGTEIGRDLADKNRLNLLEIFGQKMGLDTRANANLWRDQALVEINKAILYSYQTAGVSITDHHTAAESFMKHLENEQRLRGGCPADWVWVVPPISGHITPVFHQEMVCYILKPSYEYQEAAWVTHVWKKKSEGGEKSRGDKPKRNFGFTDIARAVKFSARLMGKALARRVKCTILYATETGKSERYAKTACEIFKTCFDAKVVCMGDYDFVNIEHEALLLVISSTFGNGDPPENGTEFGKSLFEMKHEGAEGVSSAAFMKFSAGEQADQLEQQKGQAAASSDHKPPEDLFTDSGPLSNIRFSVFGLGSTAYPHFCAYGEYIDRMLGDMGGERVHAMGKGDELCGQEDSFRKWLVGVLKSAADAFCMDANIEAVTGSISKGSDEWSPETFRILPLEEPECKLTEGLSHLHNRHILPCKISYRQNLQSEASGRRTVLVKLDTQGYTDELAYMPGDHLSIYAANRDEIVRVVLERLSNAPAPDTVFKVESLQEKTTPMGTSKQWTQDKRFPPCTLRTAFSRYLDLNASPSQKMLNYLSSQTTAETEKARLLELASDSSQYEIWRYYYMPTIADMLHEFPSLRPNASLLVTQLPLLQPRFYSISSSPGWCPGEIHATIGVVEYPTQDGKGPMRYGTCSAWIDTAPLGEIAACFIRSAPNFRLPDDPTVPCMLVGPGTGIAPFRSFWQERKIQMEIGKQPTGINGTGWGDIFLYFGCRCSAEDDIYRFETTPLVEEKVLKAAYTAYSREPNKPKVYVQDLIRKNAKEVYDLIVNKSGHFYVCGDVSMAADVSATLEKLLQEEGNLNANEARGIILKMRETSRFHEDIFGVTLKPNEIQNKLRQQAGTTTTAAH